MDHSFPHTVLQLTGYHQTLGRRRGGGEMEVRKRTLEREEGKDIFLSSCEHKQH